MPREKDFASWLRQQLTNRQMSGAELARRTGVSSASISRWVNGAEVPSSENSIRIAEAFFLDSDDVLALAGHRIPDKPVPPDDPVKDYYRKLKRVKLNPERAALLDEMIRIWLETDRESQEGRLAVHAA